MADLLVKDQPGEAGYRNANTWLINEAKMPSKNPHRPYTGLFHNFPYFGNKNAKQEAQVVDEQRKTVSLNILNGMLHLLIVDLLLAAREIAFFEFTRISTVGVDPSIQWEGGFVEPKGPGSGGGASTGVSNKAEDEIERDEEERERGRVNTGIRFYEQSVYCAVPVKLRTFGFKNREAMMQKYWTELATLWGKKASNSAGPPPKKKEEEEKL